MDRKDPVVYWRDDNKLDSTMESRLARYERFGFLFIPNLLSEGESKALLDEAKALRERARTESWQEAFYEAESGDVRSLFAIHRTSRLIRELLVNPRIIDYVSGILGDDVYVHQSRLNFKPAFCGKEFYWHSDFETWHAEDGMPRMRALSMSLSLTPTLATNGPLMLIPRSHKTFVSCPGETPEDHYRESLVNQELGTPDRETLREMALGRGIKAPTGGAGSAVLFDCNTMHGSNGNITPFPRINLFVVFNAVSNRLQEPFAAARPRPEFIAAREDVMTIPAKSGGK